MHTPMHSAPNLTFSVVLAVPLAKDDGFYIQGVFTHDADARAFMEQLDTSVFVSGSACIDKLTMEQIKDEIFEERLSSLAPLVKKVLGF